MRSLCLRTAPTGGGVHTYDFIDHEGAWFLTGNSRVYRSTDQGRNWSVVNIGAGSRYTIYGFDGALFVVYDDNIWWGIRKSSDNGNTWQDYYNGLPTTNSFSRQVWGMTRVGNQLITYNDASQSITPEPGETGFYVLNAANGSWQRENSIPNLSFVPKGFTTFEGDIYAIWENVGIYTNAAVGTSIERPEVDGERPFSVRLGQNYPNPFNPSTVIHFEIDTAGDTQLQVFDLMGREVAILLDSRLPAGSHAVSFDGSQLSRGVDVYRLQSGGQTLVRKMTIVK